MPQKAGKVLLKPSDPDGGKTTRLHDLNGGNISHWVTRIVGNKKSENHVTKNVHQNSRKTIVRTMCGKMAGSCY